MLDESPLTPYVLVLLVAMLNVISQTLFKEGVGQIGGISIGDITNPVHLFLKIISTPRLVLGIFTSACTTILWLATLSRFPVSVATPLMNGLFYLGLLAVSFFILGEWIGPIKVFAIALILVGATLLGRS